MAFEVTVATTDEGRLDMRGNELLIYDTTSGDPVALRYRSNNEMRGKHSIDKFVNGAWRELGFVAYKEDERGRTDPAHQNCLEVEFWSKKAGNSWEDADYERVFAIRHDGVVFYKGGASTSGRVTRFFSDNGKFCYNVQGDPASGPAGRIVVYDTNNNHPDENTWRAVGLITPTPI